MVNSEELIGSTEYLTLVNSDKLLVIGSTEYLTL